MMAVAPAPQESLVHARHHRRRHHRPAAHPRAGPAGAASVRCAASRRRRAASRARASPSGAPSPASTWPTWTRSSTSTRWARSTTRPGEPKGTPWHPHRGFETVTYMIDGIFEHSDSNGGGGVITNGDTQWMTAGAGILHIEKPPEALVASGGLFHGFQLWVNLPAAQKWSAAALPGPARQRGRARVLTGRRRAAAGHRRRCRRPPGPGSTYTPMTLVHATLSPGARLVLPWRPDYNALALRPGRRRHRGRGAVGRSARASWPSSGRATRSRSRPRGRRRAAARTWTC